MGEDQSQAYIRLRSKTTGEWFAHPELRPKLVADATERGTNLSEVALSILVGFLGLDYEPNGRRTHPREGADWIAIQIPSEVKRRLNDVFDAPYTDAIRHVLCEHYGLEPRKPARRWTTSATA